MDWDNLLYLLYTRNKETPIIPCTCADIWSKISFGLTRNHHHRISPLPSICTISSDSVIFKCILEVVLCEGVQHRQILTRSPKFCQKALPLIGETRGKNREGKNSQEGCTKEPMIYKFANGMKQQVR
jgi:hypothetical protein